MKLSPTQRALFDLMSHGLVVKFLPSFGRFAPREQYVGRGNRPCTAAARALLAKGLVEAYDWDKHDGRHKLRLVGSGELRATAVVPPAPKAAKPPQKTGAELGRELFELVQGDQGQAFIGDGLQDEFSADEIFGIARGSLILTERCAAKLRRWLKRHGQLDGAVSMRKAANLTPHI